MTSAANNLAPLAPDKPLNHFYLAERDSISSLRLFVKLNKSEKYLLNCELILQRKRNLYMVNGHFRATTCAASYAFYYALLQLWECFLYGSILMASNHLNSPRSTIRLLLIRLHSLG